MDKPVRIAITGAESTGKTLLTQALASHFNAEWVPEFAREYVEKLHRPYVIDDVDHIARKQIEAMQNTGAAGTLVFFDTWLIITKVWFDKVYGYHPEWLHNAIVENPVDLFLVCDTDLPWVNDPIRENGGEARLMLHKTYLREIEKYGFPYQIVRGFDTSRVNNAIAFMDDFIKKG
jgi:NadR type nicotinamide-nucleotide adenylyltransferase